MILISPEYLGIPLSRTVPPEMENCKIANSKPFFGTTPKGDYLFQNLYSDSFNACFINLHSLEEHKVTLLKTSPFFFIVVQLENTLECEVYNLPKVRYQEWSINLCTSKNFYAELSLHKEEKYSTLLFFIPLEIGKRISKHFPLIERFYESQESKDKSDKLFKNNPICNFKIMDLIKSLQNGKPKNLKTYVEFVRACFELFSKKNLSKQSDIEDKTLQKIYALKKFMLEHSTEKNFKRDDLRKKFNLTTYHFEHAFSNIYGVPPFELLRYYIMSEVKDELQKNKIGLKELAEKYHYSYNAFIRAYQSIYKQHPTIHRQKRQ